MQRSNLHNYQNRAVDFILDKRKVALFLFLGAGKSAISLTAINDLINACAIKKVLIVGPLRVVHSTWPSEINKWDHLSGLTMSVVVGTAAERKKALNSKADVYCVNKENLHWVVDFYAEKQHWPFQIIIIDESSCVKNSSTRIFRSFKKVAKRTDYIVLLSGTPSPNGLTDLWTQFFLLDQGEALGKTLTSFRNRYCQVDYFGYNWTIKAGSAEKIHELVKPMVLSLQGDERVELPDRIDITESIELPKKIKDQYKEFEKNMFIEFENTEIEALSAAVLANRLLQFTSGAIYHNEEHDWTHIHDCKLDALEELVEENPTENILLAYGYRHTLARILERFLGAVVLDKKGDALDRWNKGEIKMLVVHPMSASYGINAQYGGSLLVWFDLPWSLEGYSQLIGRLHRQGQTKPVRIIHLVCSGTIDERVLSVLGKKDGVQADLLEALR